jgi:hypothetical protein
VQPEDNNSARREKKQYQEQGPEAATSAPHRQRHLSCSQSEQLGFLIADTLPGIRIMQ